jgi:hypothetical protein
MSSGASNSSLPIQTKQDKTKGLAQTPVRGGAMHLPAHLANFGKTSGRPLPEVVQRKMESIFNTSFANVRVHVAPHAQQIGARAYTQGSNIYFAPGQYNPHSAHGQRLLAHELTHVVQQSAGRVVNPFGNGVAVVQDARLEAEANRMAMRAAMAPSPIRPRPQVAIATASARPGLNVRPPAGPQLKAKGPTNILRPSTSKMSAPQMPRPRLRPIPTTAPGQSRGKTIQRDIVTNPARYIPAGLCNDDQEQKVMRNYHLRGYVRDADVSKTAKVKNRVTDVETGGDAESLSSRVKSRSEHSAYIGKTKIEYAATWKSIDDIIKEGSVKQSKWTELAGRIVAPVVRTTASVSPNNIGAVGGLIGKLDAELNRLETAGGEWEDISGTEGTLTADMVMEAMGTFGLAADKIKLALNTRAGETGDGVKPLKAFKHKAELKFKTMGGQRFYSNDAESPYTFNIMANHT